MSKKTLTVEELKFLLLARFNTTEQSNFAKLNLRIKQELGNRFAQEEKPEVVATRDMFREWTASLLARRLKQSRRTTPLISLQDFVRSTPSFIDQMAKIMDQKFSTEERKMVERYSKVIFENILETEYAMMLPDKNHYDEYWRWVTTVLDLADERDTLPIKLLALENATDEIMRRMYTKEQYGALIKRWMNKSVDINKLKKLILERIRAQFSFELNDDELLEMEQHIEEEMPQLREEIKKIKVIVGVFIYEEVKRIYTVA